MQDSRGRYFEPFLGGGAVFFDRKPPASFLSDSNRDLIDFYRIAAATPEELRTKINLLATRQGKEQFVELRTRYPELSDPTEKAAHFFYLNRCAFNGLWRVNSRGVFNVPWGGRTVQQQESHVWNDLANALRGATLRVCDFRVALENVQEGDVVFLDPPYMPYKDVELFSRYTPSGFGAEDHLSLWQIAKEIDARGAHFLLTVAATAQMTELYSDFPSRVINSAHVVGGGSARGLSEELIVTNLTGPVSQARLADVEVPRGRRRRLVPPPG